MNIYHSCTLDTTVTRDVGLRAKADLHHQRVNQVGADEARAAGHEDLLLLRSRENGDGNDGAGRRAGCGGGQAAAGDRVPHTILHSARDRRNALITTHKHDNI